MIVKAKPRKATDQSDNMRERVLSAAFEAFHEGGFHGASTLDIATRAHVSKRELYALFDNKQAMLVACIAERARRMRLSLDLPPPQNSAALADTMTAFGTAILRGVCEPEVLAVYRLAITEAKASPEIARALDSNGRQANLAALTRLLTDAQARGLIGPGEIAAVASRFFAVLWGDLLVRLLLKVAAVPKPAEMEHRARAAARAALALDAPSAPND